VNKYLHNDTSETEVNIHIGANNGNEKLYTYIYFQYMSVKSVAGSIPDGVIGIFK